MPDRAASPSSLGPPGAAGSLCRLYNAGYVPLGVGKERDDHQVRNLGHGHDGVTAERFGSVQVGLRIGELNVQRNAMLFAGRFRDPSIFLLDTGVSRLADESAFSSRRDGGRTQRALASRTVRGGPGAKRMTTMGERK